MPLGMAFFPHNTSITTIQINQLSFLEIFPKLDSIQGADGRETRKEDAVELELAELKRKGTCLFCHPGLWVTEGLGQKWEN